jgi:hypothetical protein
LLPGPEAAAVEAVERRLLDDAAEPVDATDEETLMSSKAVRGEMTRCCMCRLMPATKSSGELGADTA